jgi:hypothetical protein
MPAVPVHTVIGFGRGGLEVKAYLVQPPAGAVAALGAGELTYGYVEPLAGFPLLLLLPGAGRWVIEGAINMLRLPECQAQAWLGDVEGGLHLTLYDAATHTVLLRRTVPTPPAFAQQLREGLGQQRAEARTAQVADEVYELLRRDHAPEQLLAQATLYSA